MYRILPIESDKNTIILPYHTELAAEFSGGQELLLEYGQKTRSVQVNRSIELEENHLLVPADVLKHLKIPLTSAYCLRVEGNKLIIGPYIGILADLSGELLAELVRTLSSFLTYYHRIGGTIVAFALDGVNTKNQEIQGYIYEPETKAWIPGTYTYPASVLSITEASLTDKWDDFIKVMLHFKQGLGSAVFNYPIFSKWDMYKLLKPRYENHLPETKVYVAPQTIKEMIEKHQTIYIKPIHGRLGRYIFQAEKSSAGYTIRYKMKRKPKVRLYRTEKSFLLFFQKLIDPGDYLIQATIPLMHHNQSLIDFRVMMAKNHQGEWQTSGIFARYGASGSIVSNITAGGRAELADKTLKKVWKLNNKQISEVKQTITELCQNVLAVIEAEGYHCGNIGVDIGIDQELSLFIIEINNQNPDPYIAKRAKRSPEFYKHRYLNMMYAKKLAGF